MRYIPGQSLDKLLVEQGRMSWEETLRMAEQIGAALDFAHAQGFLHRDVKPSNIIRTPEGEYVLTDFGLVKAMMATGLTTQTGALLGTPPYMAPEVWLGEAATPATDQYALACVLYEALTGKVLFAGETPPAVMTRHVLKGAELGEEWPPDVPQETKAMLLKALAKEPAERYPTTGEFVQALQGLEKAVEVEVWAESRPEVQVLLETGKRLEEQGNLQGALTVYRQAQGAAAGQPGLLTEINVIVQDLEKHATSVAQPSNLWPPTETPAPPVSPTFPSPILGEGKGEGGEELGVRELPRRKRPWLWVLGGLVVFAVIIAAGYVVNLQQQYAAQDTAMAIYWQQQTAAQSQATTTAQTQAIAMPTESPTQTLIPNYPIISPENADKLTELSSYNFPELARQSGQYGTAFSLDWSPDGNEIAVVPWLSNTNVIIYFFDEMLTTYNQVNLDFEYSYDFQYSPKGDILAMNSDEKKVYLIRRDGSVISMLHAVNDQPDVAFSIDGELLATGGYGTEVRFWQVNDGHLIRSLDVLDGDLEGALGVTFSPDGRYFVTKNRNGRVRLWDQFANPIFSFDKSMVQDAEFNPSGTTVAVAYVDGTVGLWDVSTGDQIELIDGGMDEVYNVAWSPNGKVLAWCGHYEQITLWDVAERKILVKVGNAEWNLGLEFSPDGKFLLSSAEDIVQLWGIP
jgi:hypothetical protein